MELLSRVAPADPSPPARSDEGDGPSAGNAPRVGSRSTPMPGVLDGIAAADVGMAPFPHVVVENCLPADLYDALAARYPSNERVLALSHKRRKGVVRPNQRHNVSAHQILGRDSLDPLWEAFVRRHTSPAFFADVARVFGPAIRATYPGLEACFGSPLESWPTGVRFDPDSPAGAISLDCQVAINTPVTKPGSVRGVHADAPEELFAMLLYFRPEADLDDSAGGDLEIWRWKPGREPAFVGKQACEQDAEHVGTVPYRANTLVAFVNSPQALHAVSVRGVTAHSRRLVNIIGDLDRSLPEGLFVKRQKPFGRLRVRASALLSR